MDIQKRNIQMHMEEIFNSIEVGECFEDKDELKQLRSELYTIIDELNDYELVNFNNCDIDYDNYK